MTEKLTEQAKQAKREYYKKYREEHKDAIKEYNRIYWEQVAKKNAKKKGA